MLCTTSQSRKVSAHNRQTSLLRTVLEADGLLQQNDIKPHVMLQIGTVIACLVQHCAPLQLRKTQAVRHRDADAQHCTALPMKREDHRLIVLVCD